MELYIKNMVCNRCIAAVKSSLNEFKIQYGYGDVVVIKKRQPGTAAE